MAGAFMLSTTSGRKSPKKTKEKNIKSDKDTIPKNIKRNDSDNTVPQKNDISSKK